MRQARWLLLIVLTLVLLPIAAHRSVHAQGSELVSCEPVPFAAATPAAAAAPLVVAALAVELVDVSFGYVPVTNFAPVYVAKELGYFAEQGLNVDVVAFAGGSEMTTELATGRLDAGMGGAGPGLFNAVDRDFPIKVIAPGHSEGNPVATPLVVSKQACESGEIRSVADLRGKRVAINAPGATEYWLSQALSTGGLTIADVDLETLAFSDAVTALGSGTLDAAMLGEPTATLAEQNGFGVRLATDFPVQDITPTVVYANSDFLTNDGDVATKLMAGYLKACRVIMERGLSDPTIAGIVAEYTQLPIELITASVAPLFSVDGELDIEGLQTLQAFFRERGELEYDTDMDPATFVDASYITAAASSLG